MPPAPVPQSPQLPPTSSPLRRSSTVTSSASEHVCIPERRLSSSSTASRRLSFSRRRLTAPTSPIIPPTPASAVSTAPAGGLPAVLGGDSDDELAELDEHDGHGHRDEDVFMEDKAHPGRYGPPQKDKDPEEQQRISLGGVTTTTLADEAHSKERLELAPSHSAAEAGDVSKAPVPYRLSRWANETVATPALVPALVTQALATGILDATTYADFHTFASNQTGNAILLTLAAVGTAKIQLLLTGTSFAGFIGFAFLFGHIGHRVGVRRRAWLLTSTTIQLFMLVTCAILLSPAGPASTSLDGPHKWVVLFLFAGMSGAQVVMARQSSCQELPTAPMTSAFVDFVADQYLFAAWGDPKATPRNRRVAYVVSMIGGSFVGAALHRWSNTWIVVVVTVCVKFVATVMLALAAGEEDVE